MKKTILIICILVLAAPQIVFSQMADPNSEGSLKMLCEEKDVSISCWKLGDRYRTLDRDMKKALSYYKKACEMGLANGCSYAGVLLAQRAAPNSKDFKKAGVFFEKACDQKHDLACFNLGSLKYKEGRRKKAIKYYDIACELGHRGACGRAAKMKK